MHISPPKGTIALTAGLPPPAPGVAPPAPAASLWAVPPATCHQGEVFVKTMGGASAGRSEAEAGCWPVGNCLQLSMGQPRREASGRESPARYSASGSKTLKLGGGEAAPRAPQGSRLSVGKCSESTYRRKWQNGGMAHFAILRVQKLKSAVAVHRSMKHSFRAQDTPNADAELTHLNEHFGAHSVAEGMAAFRSRLPESFRKDAVQAVEYLITASPEAMQGKPKSEQDAYFRDSLEWLKQRHGAENVVYAGIHRDETTPHMYAYVVPRDPESGRLNAKRWLGGAKALRDMQSEFAEQVGRQHGLERGLEGSRSRHTTIQAYYGRVEKGSQQTPNVDVPDPSIGDRVNVRAYGEKVAKSVVGQLRPKWQELTAKANELEAAKRAEREARATVDDQNKRLRPLVDALRPLNEGDRKVLASIVADVSRKIQADRVEKMRQRDQERQATRSKSRDQDKGYSR